MTPIPFNGSGLFQRLRRWQDDRDANIKIRADYADSEDDGFATGLSNCVTKDGQTTITANLPMSGFRHTGAGAAVGASDYVILSQLQTYTRTVVVATDFSKTSDTTLADVTGLTANLVAGSTYVFRAVLWITAGASGGVKLALGGTATVTDLTAGGPAVVATSIVPVTALASNLMASTTAFTRAACLIEGTITANAGGTLTVQFAQNASNGTASTVHRGSSLTARLIT